MAKVPPGFDLDELTTVARRVLLDGLQALEPHLEAITVVGAQAVYLRTIEAALSSAAYTTDGDLSLDPQLLRNEPLIESALTDAGFTRIANQSGLWQKPETIGGKTEPIELDLLVGESLAEGGRRSTRIPPHDDMATRRVRGIELACVDRSPMVIGSLESGDSRNIIVNVAGKAALLVAKAYKISDRLDDAAKYPDRLVDKDAGDALRIMMTTRPQELADTLAALQDDPRVDQIAAEGVRKIRSLFGARSAPAVDMAVAALRGDVPESRVRGLAPAFVAVLR